MTDTTIPPSDDASRADLERRIRELEQQLEQLRTSPAHSDLRFRSVLENAPDAAVCADGAGVIVWVNRRAEEFFGYDHDELIGQPLESLMPERYRVAHVVHRTGFSQDPKPRPMGTGLELFGRRKDGSEFPVDVGLSAIVGDDEPLFLALVRDMTARKEAEEAARLLGEHELLRRQALEINDVVVQGLATASYALESGDAQTAGEALRATIASARNLMGDLLGSETDFRPGELLRGAPARVVQRSQEPPATAPEPTVASRAEKPRIVVADDTPDIRLLMRAALRASFEVVGEASDGREAVEVVAREHPDAILLDLAMPVMDGLQAIPEIRRVSPETKIVVLSGYGRDQMGDEALAAGAEAYLEKGRPLEYIAETLHELCGSEPPQGADPVPFGETTVAGDAMPAAAAVLEHLTPPLTVIGQMASTLRERIDVLPSAAVRELLDAVMRNVDQATASIDRFGDALRVATGAIALAVETVDVAALTRDVVSEVGPADGRSISVEADDDVLVEADPMRIRQVLASLLSNALTFSPSASRIEVTVRGPGILAEVSVSNQGEPIPAERREQLFAGFEASRAARGLPLGLFVAQGIARAHGGDLVLERSDERGTRFTLRLPLASSARAR